MGGVSYDHGRGFKFSLSALRVDVVRNPHVQILGMPRSRFFFYISILDILFPNL